VGHLFYIFYIHATKKDTHAQFSFKHTPQTSAELLNAQMENIWAKGEK